MLIKSSDYLQALLAWNSLFVCSWIMIVKHQCRDSIERGDLTQTRKVLYRLIESLESIFAHKKDAFKSKLEWEKEMISERLKHLIIDENGLQDKSMYLYSSWIILLKPFMGEKYPGEVSKKDFPYSGWKCCKVWFLQYLCSCSLEASSSCSCWSLSLYWRTETLWMSNSLFRAAALFSTSRKRFICRRSIHNSHLHSGILPPVCIHMLWIMFLYIYDFK